VLSVRQGYRAREDAIEGKPTATLVVGDYGKKGSRPLFVTFCHDVLHANLDLVRQHRQTKTCIQRSIIWERGRGMIRIQNRQRISRRAFFCATPPNQWVRVAVVSCALAGLLVARSGPLRLSTPSAHSAVTHFSHDQRPRFDNSGSQWSIPIATFVGSPPAAFHTAVSLATALDASFRTEGAQYNRPPPCS